MRLRWFGILAAALGAAAPRPGHAEPSDIPVAVLGLETIDVPAALADQIADELRHRISASKDLKLVSGKDLVEIKLVFSCADEAVSCMVQAGKSLGAHKLIYGSVKKTGNDYAVWIKQLDVRKEALESWVTETLARKQADVPGVKIAAGRWFAKLTGHPANAGVVQVTANLYGATVLLDGSAVGVTGEQPLTLPEVAAGKHEIVAEKAGHTTARQQITVSAGQTASVNLALQPVSGAASPGPGPAPTSTPAGSATPLDIPPPARPSRTGYRVGFWVTLAAGLISAGGAVKFGMDVSRVNDDLDPLRRFTCTPPMVLECDANNVPKAPRTTAEQMEMTRLIDEGNRAQTLQWVFVGVGAAFGVASGYLFYRGYLDSVESGAPRREANRGLRIFPTAGASAGGVLAEFDF